MLKKVIQSLLASKVSVAKTNQYVSISGVGYPIDKAGGHLKLGNILYGKELRAAAKADGWLDVYGEYESPEDMGRAVLEALYEHFAKSKVRDKEAKEQAAYEAARVNISEGIPSSYRIVNLINHKSFKPNYNDNFRIYCKEKKDFLFDIDPKSFASAISATKVLDKYNEVPKVYIFWEPKKGSRKIKKWFTDEETGIKRFNLYNPPKFLNMKEPLEERNIDLFFSFMEGLIPNKKSRGMVLDWWAVSLFDRTPVNLILKGTQGVGKSLLVEIVTQTHGEDNRATVPSGKWGSVFNAKLMRSTLVVTEELYVKNDKADAKLEMMKTFPDKTQDGEAKNIDGVDYESHASFLATTNRDDCLPLGGEFDRKFYFPDLSERKQHDNTYKQLYSLCGSDRRSMSFLLEIYLFLEARFKSGIKTDFYSKFAFDSASYTSCVFASMGREKTAIYRILSGSHPDYLDAMPTEVEDKPFGVLTVIELFSWVENIRRSRSNKNPEVVLGESTLKTFLKEFRPHGEKIAEIAEGGKSHDPYTIKIVSGDLAYRSDDYTWLKYREETQ